MKDFNSLAEVFEHTLQDMYFAEAQLLKALPKVADSVRDRDLKSAVSKHCDETRGHVNTLENVFDSLGKKPFGVECEAIMGIIRETESVLAAAQPGEVLDAALIGCCQAAEHYEIARYGTLREWAKLLGHAEAHKRLSEILDQEKAANGKLTDLAVSVVNRRVMGKAA